MIDFERSVAVEITEVRVSLMNKRDDKLCAFCSITIDDAFVVRDLKIIEGAKGTFVAMPSRKLMDRCLKCGTKNYLRAGFCNNCGTRLGESRIIKDIKGRVKLHADIAHPINSNTRELLQKKVLDAYNQELEQSKQPGYKPAKIYESPEEYNEEIPPESLEEKK